jgi:hypothetical protein
MTRLDADGAPGRQARSEGAGTPGRAAHFLVRFILAWY